MNRTFNWHIFIIWLFGQLVKEIVFACFAIIYYCFLLALIRFYAQTAQTICFDLLFELATIFFIVLIYLINYLLRWITWDI